MSQENVEVLRAVYERFSEGDFRASVDLLDPHVVLVLNPEFAPSLAVAAHGGALMAPRQSRPTPGVCWRS